MVIACCYWGDPGRTRLWIGCLERVADTVNREHGPMGSPSLRRYPALFLLYGGGIAAVATANYLNFAAIVSHAKSLDSANEKTSLCSVIYPYSVMEAERWQLLPGMSGRHTPASGYLFAKLRAPLREYIPGEDEYRAAFDRFEYLFALVHADTNRWGRNPGWWGPAGDFASRRLLAGGDRIRHVIGTEIETEGPNWGPLKAGLFGGSLEQAKTAKAKFDAFIGTLRYY